jgi:hypothetical protein
MKTFLKKNLLWVFSLVLGIGTMSFKMTESSNTWHYQGSGAYNVATNWQPGSPSPGTCKAVAAKPCEISVTASTTTQLQDFFDGMSENDVENINPSSRRD